MMVKAAALAIEERGRACIEAPTGTGKTFSALVPVVTSGYRAVIVTSSLALQDQLIDKDLPRVTEAIAPNITYVAVRGRGQYGCVAKAREANMLAPERLVDWVLSGTGDGERRGCPFPVTDEEWSHVSVGEDECPGASSCKVSADCYAEHARERSMKADVIVMNMHVFSRRLTCEAFDTVDVLVIDEGHDLLDVGCSSFSVAVTPAKVRRVAEAIRSVRGPIPEVNQLGDIANELERHCKNLAPNGSHSFDDGVTADVATMRLLEMLSLALSKKMVGDSGASEGARQRLATKQARLLMEVDTMMEPASTAAWSTQHGLFASPLSIGRELAADGWYNAKAESQRAVIVCSATIPSTIERDIGLTLDHELKSTVEVTRVRCPTPFDLGKNVRLYVAEHLTCPSLRNGSWETEAVAEAVALVNASHGGAMVLCTSTAGVNRFSEAMRREGHTTFVQGDMPKGALIQAFADDHDSVLVATRSFWQGVDVPGSTLRLVILDRLPMPSPDDALVKARRKVIEGRYIAAGRINDASYQAWLKVDIPLAGTTMAQGFGRLIRSTSDRGVVAVLDPRLIKKSYGPKILEDLPVPPTRDRAAILKALAEWSGKPVTA